jgi:hypothetical protein
MKHRVFQALIVGLLLVVLGGVGRDAAEGPALPRGTLDRPQQEKLHLIRQLGQHLADEGGKIWRRVAGHGRVWRSLGERVVCPATGNERSGGGTGRR